jgi:hypothetical protein
MHSLDGWSFNSRWFYNRSIAENKSGIAGGSSESNPIPDPIAAAEANQKNVRKHGVEEFFPGPGEREVR